MDGGASCCGDSGLKSPRAPGLIPRAPWSRPAAWWCATFHPRPWWPEIPPESSEGGGNIRIAPQLEVEVIEWPGIREHERTLLDNQLSSATLGGGGGGGGSRRVYRG